MSLTSFLAEPDVTAEFRRRFDKPPFKEDAPLLAPPRTDTPGLLGLTGTAFDYLFRFAILKQHGRVDNPTKWVASEGAVRADKICPTKDALCARRLFEDAAREYMTFTQAERCLPGAGLICASVSLAQLDLIVRIGRADFALAASPRKLVVAYLERLLDATPLSQFIGLSHCLPNPHFGAASRMVGGADADLILDRTLWDVKVTKKLEFTRAMFNQLIAYSCLARLGGVDGCRPRNHRIERVGIYFARHAVLHSFALAEVVGFSEFPSFMEWFKKRARVWMAARS